MTKMKTVVPNAPWATVAPTGPVLRPADAAKFLGIRITNYYEQARRGFVPVPMRLGSGRATGVPISWLNAVIADRALNADGAAQ